MTLCEGVCRDLMNDQYNCGSCGSPCGDGQVCFGGDCVTDCPDGYTECSGVCRNLANDPSNCGTCGTLCAPGEVCLSGSCEFECPDPYIDCSGSCADTDVDHNHCGSCDNVCGHGEICVDGACTPSCYEGLTMCTGVCVDLMRDPDNCGSCAATCEEGEFCYEGTCTAACPGGFTDCSGVCRDLDSDRLNCGACDNECLSGEVCEAGVCTSTCPPGLVDCSGDCTDTSYDPAHCGSCGHACASGEVCHHGTCRSPVGFTGATGTTWDVVPPGSGSRGLQAWVPTGETYMYSGSGTGLCRLNISTGAWSTLASAPSSLAGWGSPALSNGYIWELRENNVLRYDPTANSWTIVRSDLHSGSDQHSMTVTDRDGNLWAINGLFELVRYDPIADTASYYPTGATSLFETRVGYDGLTHSIYFGGFASGALYRFDIATTTVSTRAPHPESFLNDIFCSDHWGHIYAAGSSSGTSIWQYDVLTDTWRRIPDYPVDHGNNGSCGVLQSGWLYMEPGTLSTIYRIALY
jgi:hypothetical protein